MKQWDFNKKRMIFGILILFQLLGVLFCFRGMNGEREVYSAKEQTVQLYGGSMDPSGGYYIDQNTILPENVFLSMELPDLKKGVYEVWIDYDTNAEQISKVSSKQAGYRRLYENIVSLRPSDMQKEVSYRFTLLEDVNDLKAEILYTGIGELTVKDFKVVHTRQEYSMGLFLILLFSVWADALFYFFIWNRPEKVDKKIFFGLLVIFLFSCSNLMIDYFHSGDDMMFHANRVEGIAREWMAGNFPARMESYCMYGMGYPMSIMYPEVFLWPAVLLRVIGFDLAFCIKAEYVFINLLTTLISYFSFKNIFNSRRIGLWGSAVYTLSLYRLYNIYDRAAVGEFTAMTFLPLICWGLVRVFSEKEETVRDKKTVLLLAFGYMGVLYSHVLSLEFVILYTVILCLMCWRRFFRKNTLFVFVKAALLAIGLSLWYLIPFLDYSFSAGLNVFEAGKPIQKYGLYPVQLFWFFPWKGSSPYMYVSGMRYVRGYSMGLALAAVFFCFIYMRTAGIGGKKLQEFGDYPKVRIAALMAVLAMFMSLNIFPWDVISGLSEGVRKAVYSIQFPYRFLVMATISLSFLGCALLAVFRQAEEKRKETCFAVFILALTVLGSCFYLNNEIQAYSWSDFREAATAGSAMIGGGEYLPAETEVSKLPYTWASTGNGVVLTEYDKENGHVEFRCENSGKTESYVECNLLHYPGYRAAVGETGEKLDIVSGENNVLRVKIPPGFSGSVIIDFTGKSYWKAGNAVSGVLWLLLICGGIFCYKKREKGQ